MAVRGNALPVFAVVAPQPAEDIPMTGVFSKYLGTPYQPYIRPAIPPDGILAPNSKVEPDKRGKVPGLWFGKDWIGLPGYSRTRRQV